MNNPDHLSDPPHFEDYFDRISDEDLASALNDRIFRVTTHMQEYPQNPITEELYRVYASNKNTSISLYKSGAPQQRVEVGRIEAAAQAAMLENGLDPEVKKTAEEQHEYGFHGEHLYFSSTTNPNLAFKKTTEYTPENNPYSVQWSVIGIDSRRAVLF